jgi:hypothetical protein
MQYEMQNGANFRSYPLFLFWRAKVRFSFIREKRISFSGDPLLPFLPQAPYLISLIPGSWHNLTPVNRNDRRYSLLIISLAISRYFSGT